MAKTDGRRSGRVAAASRREPLSMSEEREPRDMEDNERLDEGLELSQDEREQMLREDAMQNQLPNPPKRPGVHWFWASLTNAYTSVPWYMRMGYKPVKFEELAGWADANMRGKSGDYAGCITVNEMLLMKADEKAYQRFMHIVHHEKPLAEQKGLKDSFQRVKEEVASDSGHDGLVTDATERGEMSGVRALERTVKRPSKFE